MDLVSSTFFLKLYPDSQWKENCLTKIEIMFDDIRNEEHGVSGWDKLEDFIEYGGEYELTIAIKKKWIS